MFTNVTLTALFLCCRMSNFRHLLDVCGDNALYGFCHLALPQKGCSTVGHWGLKWPNVFAPD